MIEVAIAPDVLASHGVTPAEYDRMVEILGRHPNLTEFGIFSVMWSEHCSYKSSRIHLKKLPTRSKLVLQGPGENAGIIDIGNGVAIAFKIESHNHPSFIEPFQGAATGVGGILRDIFTMGARPIAVMDALRFGPLTAAEAGSEETAARNRRILSGVVSGISHYGNCFGVPTVGGECVFDKSYNGNPLVNVFALGVFRHDQIFKGQASGVGNPVIYVGAKTGRDGIKGASMASAEFGEDWAAKRPNVQVGDPFMEKLLLEACLEAMQTGAIVGIQDMGAAGLTCSTCEMASRAGTGIDFELDRVPQRETGMTPYEIMLSESQERMLLVAQKGREDEVFRVFEKWGLDAAEIGTVTGDGRVHIRLHGQIVGDLPARELADEAPLYDRPHGVAPYRAGVPLEAPEIPASADLNADLLKLLASGDLCSKRWIWEQYDYQVRTNTLAGPGADAAIVRIKETGTDNGTSIAMSLDGNGRWCLLDPREGVKLIVAECCRNLSVAGALPVAATNNLNYGNPERPEIMAQLVEGIEGLGEACAFFETPITGGNVSLYNETRIGDKPEPIHPSPVVGIVGLMKTETPVGIAFKNAGRAVMLIGGVGECEPQRFGGTEYAHTVLGKIWGLPPKLDMAREKAVQAAIREMVAGRVVESAHDVGSGGLAVALAEACFGGVGASVNFTPAANAPVFQRTEFLMFHEGPSRIVVSTANPRAVAEIAAKHGVEVLNIGSTVADKLSINKLIDLPIAKMRDVWEQALPNLLGVEK